MKSLSKPVEAVGRPISQGCIVMAYILITYIVMAYVVMAYMVMVYVVMTGHLSVGCSVCPADAWMDGRTHGMVDWPGWAGRQMDGHARVRTHTCTG